MHRRLLLVAGFVLVAAMTVWEVYEFLATNEGLHYFISNPRRLLPVIFIGIAGGIVALGLSRLSPSSKRAMELFVLLGLVGLAVLMVLGAFALKSWFMVRGGH